MDEINTHNRNGLEFILLYCLNDQLSKINSLTVTRSISAELFCYENRVYLCWFVGMNFLPFLNHNF